MCEGTKPVFIGSRLKEPKPIYYLPENECSFSNVPFLHTCDVSPFTEFVLFDRIKQLYTK